MCFLLSVYLREDESYWFSQTIIDTKKHVRLCYFAILLEGTGIWMINKFELT